MSKYSNKILTFLKEVNRKVEVNGLKDIKSFEESQNLSIVYKTLIDSQAYNPNIELIDQTELKAIHTHDQYPLMFIFFFALHECGILQRVVHFLPDIKNFDIFVKWHRENYEHIDMDKISRIIEDLPNYENKYVQVGGSSKKMQDYTKVIEIYRLLFYTKNARAVLHNNIYRNKFISLDVQHDIESNDLFVKTYTIDNVHTVNIYYPKKLEQKNIPKIKDIAYMIHFMSCIAKNTENINHKTPVDLVIVLSDQKKIFPCKFDNGEVEDEEDQNINFIINDEKDNESMYAFDTRILCADNVNSGSTYPGRSIICWRREELYKVIIHELVHYYKYDFFSSDDLHKKVDIIKYDGIDMINESYTESLTVIILCLLGAYQKVKDNDPIKILSEFKIRYFNEINFLLLQTAKIIHLFNGNEWEDLLKGSVVIKQNTSVRSYYIYKLIILTNFDTFIKFIDNGIIVQNKRLIEFGNLIDKSLFRFNKTQNVDIINHYLSIMEKNIPNNKKWVYRTGRMTVSELFSEEDYVT